VTYCLLLAEAASPNGQIVFPSILIEYSTANQYPLRPKPVSILCSTFLTILSPRDKVYIVRKTHDKTRKIPCVSHNTGRIIIYDESSSNIDPVQNHHHLKIHKS
jgi:hypothetical protein